MAYQPNNGQRLVAGPAWVDYSTIRTFPALEQKSSWFERSILDPMRSYARDANGLLAGAGWMAEQMGAEDFGEAIQEFSRHGVDYWQSSITPETQAAVQKDMFEVTDQGVDFNWTKLINGVAGSAPSFVVGLGAGGVLAKGLQLFANPLGRTALVEAINAGKVAGPGTTAWATAESAAKSLQFVDNLIGIGGYGASEGAMAGAAVGAEVSNTIKAMDHATLSEKSERYRALYDSYDGEPEERRQQLAKGALADEASTDAGWKSGLATAVLGAPAGAFFGRVLGPSSTRLWAEAEKFAVLRGSRLGAAVEGFATEGISEAAQSGSEQMFTNLGIQQADETKDTWEGVGAAAIEGGIIGGVLGGGVGAVAGNEHTQQAQIDSEKEADQRNTDRLIATSLEAIKGHGLDDYAAKILEAQPERGRLQTLSDLAYMAENGEVRDGTLEELFPDLGADADPRDTFDQQGFGRTVRAEDAGPFTGKRTAYSESLPAKGEDEGDKDYAYRMIDMVGQPTELPEDYGRYFEMKKADFIVPIEKIKPAKKDRSSNNSTRLMALAGEGVLPRRAPIDVKLESDGSYTILDGNGTHAAAKTFGWKEMPVRVKEVAPDLKESGFRTYENPRGFLKDEATNRKLTEIYRKAEADMPAAQELFGGVAGSVGGSLEMGDLKGRFRAEEKTAADYGGDPTRLKDLVRGTIVVDTVSQARDVAKKLGAKVVEQKDSLSPDAPAYPGGYRDMKLIVDVNGTRSELQINLRPMVDAKDKAHKLYDKARTLEGQAKIENRDLTPIETIKLNALIKQQEQIYLPAWESILSQEAAGSGYSADGLSRSDASSRRPGAPGASNATSAEPVESDIQATGMPSYQNSSLPAGKSAADLTPPAITSERDFTANSPSSTSGSIVPRQQSGDGLRFSLRESANEAATSDLNDRSQPTAAQTSAGNYAHGHRRVKGLDVSFENPAGSTRVLAKREGKIQLKDHYGYVRGFTGADGDKLDVYVRDTDDDTIDRSPIFAVEQLTPDGKYDEDKVYMGYDSDKEVRASFLAHQQLKPAMRMGPKIRKFDDVAAFRRWAKMRESQHQKLATAAKKAAAKTLKGAASADQIDVTKLPTGKGAPIRIVGLEVAKNIAKARKFKKGRDLKLAMQDEGRAARAASGVDLREQTQAAHNILAQALVADAVEAMKTNSNAIGWYDDKVSKALSVLALTHPEIATDKASRVAFIWALAVTSNGQKVAKNFELAQTAYAAWKATGKMPTDIGIGNPKEAINNGMELFNALSGRLQPAELERFLATKFTVGEIEAAIGVKPSGEWTGTVVRGAAIAGPKVGNGFLANLMGFFDALTMDRWFMRTWGRITGDLVEVNKKEIAKKSDALAALVAKLSPKDSAALAGMIKGGIDAAPQALAEAIDKASLDTGLRETMQRSAKLNAVRLAARALNIAADGSKEAPSGPGQRAWIRTVMGTALRELQVKYPNLTMADLQALLWYPEKKLYDSAKESGEEESDSYSDDEAPDYANASVAIARAAGFKEADIQAALSSAGSVASKQVKPFDAAEKAAFLRRTKAPPEQTQTIVFEVAPDPENVELTAQWNALSAAVKKAITRDVGEWVTSELARALKLKVLAPATASGGFGGQINPNQIAAFAEKNLSYDQAQMFAAAVGKVLDQASMVLVDSRSPEVNGVIRITTDGNEASKNADEIWSIISKAIPEIAGDGFTARGKTMDVLNLTKYGSNEISDVALHDKIIEALTNSRFGSVSGVSYGKVRSALIGRENYDGKIDGVRLRDRARVQREIARITADARARIDAGIRDAGGPGLAGAARLADGAADGQAAPDVRFRLREEGSAGSAPDARGAQAEQGQVAPKFTSQKIQKDAVSAVGIHYGKAGLKALDPTMAGTGAAGGERRRLGMGRFGLTNPRVNFYIREPGQAVPPSEAVVGGAESYQVELMNLYDYDADPRGFFAKYPNNVDMVEEEVTDAGFDGILFPKHPQIPVRTAIVFGFKRKIPVVPVPAGEPVMDLRYALKDGVSRSDKMLDIPSVEIGRGGRAPAGGIYVSGRFYDGGEFLPEEYPGGKSAARKLAAKVDGNIAELRVRPASASTGAGKAWIEVKMAGQDRFRIMGSSPFDSLEKAIFVAGEIVSERDNYYRSRGVMPHPTEVTVVGDDAKYSIGEQASSGLSAKAVQGLVNTLNWAGKDKIRVYENEADLPAHLLEMVPTTYRGRVQGFYDPASKSVVIVSRNIDSPEEAYRTIVEEHLRHEGLRRFFTPAKMDQFLDGIYSALPQEGLRAVAKTYSANLDKPEGRRLAAEEYIAKMKLDQERSPLMARVGDWVRGQLRSLGFKMTYSNRDVIHILQQIEDGVRSGRIASPAWNGVGDDPVAPMYSLSGETDRWYYSAMLRSVETGTGAPKKAGATQWKQWLDGAQRRGEFKQAEREWLGVDEWLDGRGETTRAELVEFVNSNQVMVDETVLGDVPSIPWKPATEDDLPDGISSGSKYTTRGGETFTKFQFAGGWYAEVSSRGGRSRKVVDNAESEEALDAELMTYVAGELETPSSVKFDGYQLPGGQNYRELLLTMPVKDGAVPVPVKHPVQDGYALQYPNGDYVVSVDGGARHERSPDPSLATQWETERYAGIGVSSVSRTTSAAFESSHFPDQPNILAHVRFNERVDADGKRVLFVEEVQSDWDTAGRDMGYVGQKPEDEARIAKLGAKSALSDGEAKELARLKKRIAKGTYAVPRKPDADIGLTAMKRMIRWAAENGFDRVAWTTGAQQNERYKLSKQVRQINYVKDSGGFRLSVIGNNGQGIDLPQEVFAPNELAAYVGKAVADDIINDRGVDTGDGYSTIEGEGLNVGGEGMRGFYDKMLPTEVGKYVKKFGGQVGSAQVLTGSPEWRKDPDGMERRSRGSSINPSIDITESMRQAAIAGQPLFRLRDVTSTPEIEGARRFISGPRPAAMSLGDRVRVLIRDIYRTWTKQNALEIEQGLFDSGASIKDWEKRLTGALQDASESAGKMYDLARNPAAVLASVMRTGVPRLIDGAFQPVAGRKGLIDVFRPLYEQAPAGTTLVHLWEDYAAARRSSRLITEQNRDGSSREKQLSQDQIDELLKLETTYPIFRQVFDDWQAFNSQMLDFAVENGVLSAQMRKMWAANDYVPFYRVIEELTDQAAGNSSSSRLTGRQVRSKRLTGGVGVIEPIFESIVKNSAYVLDSVYKNETMKRTVKMLAGHALTRAPMSFQPVRFNAGQIEKALDNAGIVMMSTQGVGPGPFRNQLRHLTPQQLDQWNTMFTMVAPAGSNVVSVMIDGKAQYYFVDDPLLLRSIQAIGPQSMSHLMKFMSGGKELLTNLVTTDPGFMAVNFLRDTISAWVTSSAPFRPVLDGFKGAMDSWRDDPLRWKLQTAGASLGGYYDTRGADAYAAMELDTGSAPKLGIRANWRRWQRFGAHFENANRMAIARSIIDSGGTVAEAAYQALDIMNFSMHGDSKSIRALTMTVPFMNARLQGLYRLWRGRNAASFWQRGAIIAGVTLALMFKNWDDDRYWELEEFERDAYWHFWLGEEHIKIAKPFEVGQLFGTIWERTAATAFGPDTARLLIQRMGSMAFDTFAMNPVPQIVKPIIEQYANKNSFTGRPIENQSLQGLLPEQRYMPWTSESARVFAAALPDWAPAWLRSPVRVEALVRGYMGTLGLYALQASDQIARPLGGFGEPPAMALKDMPVVRRFYGGDTATRTRYEEPIYKLLDIANETRKSVMELRRRGDVEGANEIAQSNADILAARGRLNAFSTQMRALNMQERAVWNSSSTAEEKKVKIDALRARRNDMLRNSSELLEKLDPYLPYL